MIIAKNFRIEDSANKVYAKFDLMGPGFPDEFSFDVHPGNADAIDIAEPNWAALALVYQAMLMQQELIIEADLSPIFLNNLNNDLQSLIRNYEPRTKAINIIAGQTSSPNYTHQDKHVSTGFSGGVDSFTTFQLFANPNLNKGVRLTSLCVFNVGALGFTSEMHNHQLEAARARCKAHADAHQLKTFSVGADMNALFAPAKKFGPVDFPKTVGFRNAATALLLQKQIGTYLPSPAGGYDTANFGPDFTTEYLDPALQPLFSTESMRFQAGGAGLSRARKIALIADNPDAQTRLNVCVGDMQHRYQPTHINCSRCRKCGETMYALEQLGKLNQFERVFDLDYYYAHRAEVHRQFKKRKRRNRRKRWQLALSTWWRNIKSGSGQ